MTKPQKPADWLNAQADLWQRGVDNSIGKEKKDEVCLAAAVSAAFRISAQKAELEGWSVKQ